MTEAEKEAREAPGYADAIADLRWLADARDEYTSEDVKPAVMTARLLAEILAETTPVSDGGTGWGWLPSWLWDEWDARKARRGALLDRRIVRAPAEPAVRGHGHPWLLDARRASGRSGPTRQE